MKRGDGSGSVTPWVWRSSAFREDRGPFPEGFYLRETKTVARNLLGCYLRSTVNGITVGGVIVETEAYVGPHDPASHAAARIGKTQRNAAMFGPPGHAYVYRIYGVHWCLNVVTEKVGYPAAVLVRAIDPVHGLEAMEDRRGGRPSLCGGPGRLSQAFGIGGDLDGHPLGEEPLELCPGWPLPDAEIGISGRIGVRHASDWPLRFFVRGHPEVSRGPR